MNFKIQNEYITANFDSLGAELVSLKKCGKEYIWEGDEKYWGGHSPFLFPIVGGLRGGKAIIDGESYEMPRHGFIREMAFECANKKVDEITFIARANDDTKKMYPFDFSFKVTYRLDGFKLITSIEITNCGDREMPFCLGGHPGISVPKESYNDYTFYFDRKVTNNCMSVVVDLGLVDTSNRTPFLKDEDSFNLSHDLFKIDAVIFDEDVPKAITLKNRKSGEGVRVEYPDFEFLGIWSTPDPASFVCIEPWSGYCTSVTESDDFRKKVGMTELKSKESKVFVYSLEIL
jgi:galactose mutarotase-like enzyme